MSARVSVVIPAHHRPEAVVGAVQSALCQTYPVHEVVVVIDGHDERVEEALAQVRDPRLTCHVVQEAQGAAAARNRGIRLAEGEVVAFLDDDDTWLPHKIDAQMTAWTAAAEPERLVVATAAVWRTDEGEVVWPRRGIGEHESVADYLFVRGEPGEGMLATPTLLLSRSLALSVPMPTHRAVHEDWDWLLTLDGAGARFVVITEPHVVVDGATGRASLSSGGDWGASLSWALSRRHDLGPRAFSGFLLSEAGRAAAQPGGSIVASAAILLLSFTGRPRGRDLTLFLMRAALPGPFRRRLQARYQRASGG